jgi:hypothetical protein
MDFALFLREKQYLENVSPNTLRWYRHALKWLPAENPDEQALKDMVIRMREAGLKETGCNAAIRAINCYLRWRGSPHTVRQLKERAVVLPIFTTEQIKRLICYKPRTAFQQRLHLLIMASTSSAASEAPGPANRSPAQVDACTKVDASGHPSVRRDCSDVSDLDDVDDVDDMDDMDATIQDSQPLRTQRVGYLRPRYRSVSWRSVSGISKDEFAEQVAILEVEGGYSRAKASRIVEEGLRREANKRVHRRVSLARNRLRLLQALQKKS